MLPCLLLQLQSFPTAAAVTKCSTKCVCDIIISNQHVSTDFVHRQFQQKCTHRQEEVYQECMQHLRVELCVSVSCTSFRVEVFSVVTPAVTERFSMSVSAMLLLIRSRNHLLDLHLLLYLQWCMIELSAKEKESSSSISNANAFNDITILGS